MSCHVRVSVFRVLLGRPAHNTLCVNESQQVWNSSTRNAGDPSTEDDSSDIVLWLATHERESSGQFNSFKKASPRKKPVLWSKLRLFSKPSPRRKESRDSILFPSFFSKNAAALDVPAAATEERRWPHRNSPWAKIGVPIVSQPAEGSQLRAAGCVQPVYAITRCNVEMVQF